MKECETCGNKYANTFTVTMNGTTHHFDSFECAIDALAPTCEACGTRVLGHGVDADDKVYCGAHCARKSGISEARDSV